MGRYVLLRIPRVIRVNAGWPHKPQMMLFLWRVNRKIILVNFLFWNISINCWINDCNILNLIGIRHIPMHNTATFSHLNRHDTIICHQQIWNRYSVELSIMVWGEWIVWCFHLKLEDTSLKLFVSSSKTLWKRIIGLGFFEKMGINKIIKSDKINERRHVKKNPLIEHGNQTYHQFHL